MHWTRDTSSIIRRYSRGRVVECAHHDQNLTIGLAALQLEVTHPLISNECRRDLNQVPPRTTSIQALHRTITRQQIVSSLHHSLLPHLQMIKLRPYKRKYKTPSQKLQLMLLLGDHHLPQVDFNLPIYSHLELIRKIKQAEMIKLAIRKQTHRHQVRLMKTKLTQLRNVVLYKSHLRKQLL